MKNGKRILKVTVNKMVDDSPDTSYYGEYSARATSPYSIDREHTLECAVNRPNEAGRAKLERIQQAVADMHNAVLAQYNGTLANGALDAEREELNIAYDNLGELLDTLTECDCGESGDRGRNELRYFNPSDNYKGEPEADVRKYVRQDYERMEKLNAGFWWYFGIRADASVILVASEGIAQDITSGGVWGIESDSSKSDVDEVEADQLAELRDQLKAIGFSSRAISAAFKNVQHADA